MGIALKYFMCTWKGHEETLRVQILLNVILLVDGGGGPLDRREREREKGKPIWEFSPLSFVTFPMKNARQLHHRIKNWSPSRRLPVVRKQKFAILSQKRNKKISLRMRVGGIHHHIHYAATRVCAFTHTQPQMHVVILCVCLEDSAYSKSHESGQTFLSLFVLLLAIEKFIFHLSGDDKVFHTNPCSLLPLHFPLWQVATVWKEKKTLLLMLATNLVQQNYPVFTTTVV